MFPPAGLGLGMLQFTNDHFCGAATQCVRQRVKLLFAPINVERQVSGGLPPDFE